MEEFGRDRRINKNYGQPLFDDALFPDEDSALAEMKRQYMAKQREMKVREAFYPYIRKDSKITYYDKIHDRYRIRIPLALRKKNSFISAKTKQRAFDKAYIYLFGDDRYTVRILFEIVLAQKEKDPDTSSLTVTRYKEIWKKYYEHAAISDRPVTELKASEIKKFFKEITGGRTITRKNFVNIKSIFNVVYDIAVENDIVSSNLSRNLSCRDLKFKAVDNSNVRYTDEDRNKILAYLDNLPEKDGYDYGIELMFCLCARIGELRALHWTDVDFERKTISISKEIVLRRNEEGKNRFVEANHTKGGEHGSRILPLSERAERVLYALKAREVTSEYICCNLAGAPIDGNKFNMRLKKITKEVGIPYMSSHKIRFWSVTALARATDGDLQTVMYAAGHVNKNTTLHYIRAVQSDIQFDKIKNCFD